MARASDSEHKRYGDWLAAVNNCIFARLGGDQEPNDSNGFVCGDARFTYDMNGQMGEVTYIIDLPHHPLRTTRATERIEWRALQPYMACEKIMETYETLRREAL